MDTAVSLMQEKTSPRRDRLTIRPGVKPRATPLASSAGAFIAGFLSTLVLHQGVLTLLWLSGAISRVPYDMTRTAPLGVPAVLSLAVWGGIWGAAIWPSLKSARGREDWLRALLIGALVPSVVSLFIVLPLKGMPVAGGWDLKIIASALVLNGSWGLGVALFMRNARV